MRLRNFTLSPLDTQIVADDGQIGHFDVKPYLKIRGF